ncbi:MAG: glutamine amidotransferase [Pirellulaceae bacterium]
MTRFGLEPIYGSFTLAIACAIAVVLVITLVTPPTQNPSHRRWLILLRSAAALALLLAAMRPSLIRTDNLPAEAVLIVAADTSQSMTLPDRDGRDRWTTQLQAWQEISRGLSDADEFLQLKLLTYDRDVRELTTVADDALSNVKPSGDLTDLGIAASHAIQAAAGKPIAGVVMLGDGAQTASLNTTNLTGVASSQAVGVERSIETLNSLGVPFWPIPIGPSAGAQSQRDVEISTLNESFQLFAGNEFDVPFQIVTRGLSGVEVPVELQWINSAGEKVEAAERSVVPEKSSEAFPLSIPLTAPAPGRYRLVVNAPTQSGELVTSNNQQVAFVDVREGGGRILYLEGTARPEQTFLRRSLRRFPDLFMTYDLLRTDRTWPIDLGTVFKPGKFDVYIIGDLDSAALGNDQLEQLTQTIGKGAGLIMLGGFHTYDTGGYADTPLADVIPIRMDGSLRRDIRDSDLAENKQGQIAGPVQAVLTRNDRITDLGGDDPAKTWAQLPPMKGANLFSQAKALPGVQVLLQTEKEQPLLVTGEFGSGRVAALAFDSTYQWWRHGQSEAHRRFWRQLVLWLLAREESGGDKIIIDMDSRRFAIDSPSEFRGRLESLDGQTGGVDLVAEIVDASGQIIPIAGLTKSNANGEVTVRGRIPKLSPGIFDLQVRPASSGSSIQPARLPFQAVDQSREMSRLMADPVYLKQLADLTADHGGRAFSPDEIGDLIQLIKQRRRRAETPVVEKHRLGDGPISGWLVFLFFAIALSTEWFLRRQWGMA